MHSEDSGIEEMRKRVYAKSGESVVHPRRPLHEEAYEVEDAWHHDDDVPDDQPDDPSLSYDPWSPEVRVREEEVAGSSILRRIARAVFLSSALFFLVAAGFAGYMYYTGKTEIRQPEFAWEGPVQIGAGEEALWVLRVTNPNQVPLLSTDLRIRFPTGTRSPSNASIALTEYKESLGTIQPQETKTATIRAVLFGREESIQTIGAALEYQVIDSATTFTSTASSSVRIARAPVSVTVEGVRELASGQLATLTVTVGSNVRDPVRGVVLRATYPPGFQVQSVQPKPVVEQNTWSLGDIAPGKVQTVVITGVLAGNGGESRIFRFEAGQEGGIEPGKLAGVYHEVDHTITLEHPFLDLALGLDGSVPGTELVTKPNTQVNGSIAWRNNVSYTLSNVQVKAKLTGAVLDRTSVEANDGFYRSTDDTIIWTPQTAPVLATVGPGESGVLTFSFKSLPLKANTGAREPTISVEISAQADRAEANVSEVLERFITRTIKLESELSFTPRVVWSVGPFQNTGPFPPRADETTTYTVLWSVTNSTNGVRETELVAELPVYVSWQGVTNPTGADLRFDEKTRKVLWRVGSVAAGAGYSSAAPEVAFQIALTPSVSQRGQEVSLVTDQQLSAVDQFTRTVIETKRPDLTTRLLTDPGVSGTDGKVAR